MGAALEGHVRSEEEAARDQPPAVCARLAGEFHIKLAQLAATRCIERYVSELVSRCSLILAIYGNPHSSQCGIDEHHTLIDAFRRGDEKTAVRLMVSHLCGVQERALMPEKKPVDADLGSILGRYARRAAPAAAKRRPRRPEIPHASFPTVPLALLDPPPQEGTSPCRTPPGTAAASSAPP